MSRVEQAARRAFSRPPAGWTRLGTRLLVLLREGALVWFALLLYQLTSNAAPRRAASAVANGRGLLRFERWLHVDPERAANAWWTGQDRTLVAMANAYYGIMHFAVPGLALFLVFVCRPTAYRRQRSALLVASLCGLAVFWLWPTAPPRLIPGEGFVDVVATVRTLGIGGPNGTASIENPYAALPSLHVAWAAWAAVAIAVVTRRRWVRALVLLHLAVTIAVIVLTANHLLVDAVAGLATTGLGYLLVGLFLRARRRLGVRRPPPSTPDRRAADGRPAGDRSYAGTPWRTTD